MKLLRVLFFYLVLIACTAPASEAQTVYITRTGEKYHVSTCQYLRKSKISISMKDAIDRGYEPCSVCEPGTLSKQSTQTSGTRNSSSSSKPNEVTSKQCSATTQAGTRCKRMTTNASGRCYQHQ